MTMTSLKFGLWFLFCIVIVTVDTNAFVRGGGDETQDDIPVGSTNQRIKELSKEDQQSRKLGGSIYGYTNGDEPYIAGGYEKPVVTGEEGDDDDGYGKGGVTVDNGSGKGGKKGGDGDDGYGKGGQTVDNDDDDGYGKGGVTVDNDSGKGGKKGGDDDDGYGKGGVTVDDSSYGSGKETTEYEKHGADYAYDPGSI
jgi:hypothetical protein